MNAVVNQPNQPPRAETPKADIVDQYSVFRCTIPNSKFTFPWGKDANFLNGEFATNNQPEIEYIQNEIAVGHPHITYVGERNELFADPYAEVKAKAVADYIASQARAMNAAENISSSEAGKLNVASTATIAAAASGSSSGAALMTQGAKAAGAAIVGNLALGSKK